MTNKPKCLVLDIETFGLLVSTWELKDQYLNYKQVKKDWSIAAWAGKWLGESPKKVFYEDQRNRKDKRNDKKLLKQLRDLLDKADFVMTQNGIKFDWPKIQARLMLNGIEPPSHFQHIDLYKEYKSVGFTSHSLDYMTEKFCVKYKKLHHSDFPGNMLWDECENGNLKAWKSMQKYNIHDVLSLEEFFENTKQWLPKVTHKLSHPVTACHKCGGKSFNLNGTRGTYIRKICKACGTWAQEKICEIGS